jgi:DNA primase
LSGPIPEYIINQVRDSVDILELVGRYVKLTKSGVNHKAPCPFHAETKPSFIVTPSRQTFHCFGCGKGGNVFRFLMEIERLSFPEAVRMLAREVGITIPETGRPERPEERDERQAIYDANRRAAAFFARQLAGPPGSAAREYVRERGISDEMVERCRLGYAPDSWDALLTAAQSANVPASVLVTAGLAIQREDSPGCYDRFRNRLMFPIYDTRDRVIGFGARTMADSDVKYLNTPETPIFSKGRNLYGLNWARKAIIDAGRVAVVEGYTDVIMAHQHGCDTVVATLGTALTRDHIRTLRRFAERIDVVFDADAAGQRAAERSMEIFLAEGAGDWVAAGFDVRIVTIPGEQDPCEFLIDHGADAFREALDTGVDVFTRKLDIAVRRHGTEHIEDVTKVMDEVLELVALIPNAVGRELRTDAVIRTLADRFGVEDAAVRSQLGRVQNRLRYRPRANDTEAPERVIVYDMSERTLIEALLLLPDRLEELVTVLGPEDFGHPNTRAVFEAVREQFEESGTVNPTRLLDRLEDADQADLVSAIINQEPRPGLDDTSQDCLRVVVRRRLQRDIDDLRSRIRAAAAAGDSEQADKLNGKFLKLQREVLAL